MEQKDYAVTIRASLTKTIHVKADSVDNAERMAHEMFTTVVDEWPETYEQDTVSTKWTGWED